MSEHFDPYDADRPLMMGCSCGRHRSGAEHAAAELRARSQTAEFELYSNEFIEASLVKALFPQDAVRRTIGRVFDSLYSTGERDKFRTRVERTAKGSEVYISHRGVEEVYVNQQKDSTVWQPRAADPQLEAAFLSRLMQKLGVAEEAAKTAVANAPAAPTRARMVAGQVSTLQVDDNFDRAWRRVGLALDRGGFTVEDRDRAQGLYFVRYVDPKDVGKGEPGFFAKLFGKTDAAGGPLRYRVQVKGDGDRSTVAVLSAQGAPEAGENGQRIVSLLLEELK